MTTNLQRIRKERGYTQDKLAELSGVKTGTIKRYEIGYRSIDGANLETLTALAAALNVKFYDLIEDQELKQKIQKTT